MKAIVDYNTTTVNICRICYCSAEESGVPLTNPCLCTGSIKFVDQACLRRWMGSSDSKSCELCKQIITVKYNLKPFSQWTRPSFSRIECADLIDASKTFLLCVVTVMYGYFMWWRRTEMESGIDAFMSLVSLAVLSLSLRTMYLMWTEITILVEKWKVNNSYLVVSRQQKNDIGIAHVASL